MVLSESCGSCGGYGAFGANDEWCDQKYPVAQATSDAARIQLQSENAKCKRGGLFAPWTIAGRLERGLTIEDKTLSALIRAGAALTGGQVVPAQPVQPPATAASIGGVDAGTIAVVAAIGGGLFFIFRGGKKGRRSSSRRRRR